MLMEPSQTNLLSKGYQVKIIMKVTLERLHCLKIVAYQYGYDVHVEPNNWSVTIYRPPGKKKPKTAETGMM
jgi:hypothetical protein